MSPLTLLLVSLAGIASANPQPNYKMKWENFKKTHGKNYSGAVEEEQRYQIFKVNVDFIYNMNSQNRTFQLGVTEYADLTADEFAGSHFGIKKPDNLWGSLPNLGTHNYKGEHLEDSVNWATKGAVTPVKDQGSCGGCWSFAATGALEGATKVAGNSLVSLSEQQFLDCDKTDSGCGGGLEYQGWEFFKSAGEGICTESSYPYKARNNNCASSGCTLGIKAGGISGVTHVGKSKSALESALNSRPVAIGIQADQSAFQFYSGGILTGTCGTQLDHSVLAVGYGSDYWKVKNSWGASWGENGYIKISNSGDKCGILDDASYPTVKAGSIEV